MIFQAEFSVEGGNIHPTKVGKDGASSDVPRPVMIWGEEQLHWQPMATTPFPLTHCRCSKTA